MSDPLNILHVLNYGHPAIDGYTARSIGLLTAQKQVLGYRVAAATSPFAPLTPAADPELTTPAWGPEHQIRATRDTPGGGPHTTLAWERPQLGLAPVTQRIFREELASIARRVGAEVIHSHHPHHVGRNAARVARGLGLPFVYELRCINGDYDLDARNPYYLARGHWQNQLEYRVARSADAVVTISDGLAERIARHGVDRSRIHVIRNAVNTAMFTPVRAEGESTHEPGTLHLGYATTFEAMEGLDVLVRAIDRLRQPLANRGVTLKATLAGTGREWEAINALVDELDLRDTVDLPGFVPYGRMPALYRSMDLFVVPRRPVAVASDTTPLKPLEALACGLPLLASDLPAMRELLEGRPDARFFAPGDPASLAEAVERFAAEPWAGTGEIEGRSWAGEVTRYPAVYAAARENARRDGLLHDRRGGGNPEPSAPRRVAKRLHRAAADAGLPGFEKLDTHVVVCGFPRTGSTLLQLMAESCVEGVMTFPGEVDARWAAEHANRKRPFLLTKLPADVHALDAVRAWYADHPGSARFVLMVRDPRDVLTSRHAAYTAERGYYVEPDRFARDAEAVLVARADADVTVLRYETLVGEPEVAEHALADAIGWRVTRPFARFERAAAEGGAAVDSMTAGALGGVRPLETSRVDRWREPAHRDRLVELLDALPELPRIVRELGYADSDAWVEQARAAAAPGEAA